MAWLSAEKQDALRTALEQQMSCGRAARLIGISETTVINYRRRWGYSYRAKHMRSRKERTFRLPRYAGPAWIGKAAS
jgi:transposase-like protein